MEATRGVELRSSQGHACDDDDDDPPLVLYSVSWMTWPSTTVLKGLSLGSDHTNIQQV